jgi:copper oxidase (laccase) domain-containing protein
VAHTVAVPTTQGRVTVLWTERSDGDFHVDGPAGELDGRRRALKDQPWTWLRQVHGNRVVEVTEPGQWAGTEADGAVTAVADAPLAVTTADCAPVVLVAERGVGVVHAGWRGLAAGIVQTAADRLRTVAGAPVAALVGPCIGPAAYEFSADDLAVVTTALGPAVVGRTGWGTSALDVPAAVASACRAADWPEPGDQPSCTSGERWFSHRTRADAGRQTTVAWFEPPTGAER